MEIIKRNGPFTGTGVYHVVMFVSYSKERTERTAAKASAKCYDGDDW